MMKTNPLAKTEDLEKGPTDSSPPDKKKMIIIGASAGLVLLVVIAIIILTLPTKPTPPPTPLYTVVNSPPPFLETLMANPVQGVIVVFKHYTVPSVAVSVTVLVLIAVIIAVVVYMNHKKLEDERIALEMKKKEEENRPLLEKVIAQPTNYLKYIIGAVVGLVVIIIVAVVLFMSRSSTPPPPPNPNPSKVEFKAPPPMKKENLDIAEFEKHMLG